MITYAQVNTQLGHLLSVTWPPVMQNILDLLSNINLGLNLFVNSDCLGLGRFHAKWMQSVVLQPLLMAAMVWFAVMYQYCRAKMQNREPEGRRNMALSYGFFAFFICFPALCQFCFGTLQCSPSLLEKRQFSVLLADDRVSCEDETHQIYVLCSVVILIVVGFGSPIGIAVFLTLEYKRVPKYSSESYDKVARQLKLPGMGTPKGVLAARDMIDDIWVGSNFGVLTSPYRSKYLTAPHKDCPAQSPAQS